jgi:hypothetical protein
MSSSCGLQASARAPVTAIMFTADSGRELESRKVFNVPAAEPSGSFAWSVRKPKGPFFPKPAILVVVPPRSMPTVMR